MSRQYLIKAADGATPFALTSMDALSMGFVVAVAATLFAGRKMAAHTHRGRAS